ncbi:MAG: hypothetical protein ACRDSE_08445 [Pseudonocardiaceae bacterium]
MDRGLARLLKHEWALPVLFALHDGPAQRDVLQFAANRQRPADNLSDTMLTLTTEYLAKDGLVTIDHLPGRQDTHHGATYAATQEGKALVIWLRPWLHGLHAQFPDLVRRPPHQLRESRDA